MLSYGSCDKRIYEAENSILPERDYVTFRYFPSQIRLSVVYNAIPELPRREGNPYHTHARAPPPKAGAPPLL